MTPNLKSFPYVVIEYIHGKPYYQPVVGYDEETKKVLYINSVGKIKLVTGEKVISILMLEFLHNFTDEMNDDNDDWINDDL